LPEVEDNPAIPDVVEKLVVNAELLVIEAAVFPWLVVVEASDTGTDSRRTTARSSLFMTPPHVEHTRRQEGDSRASIWSADGGTRQSHLTLFLFSKQKAGV
jgi:hypothetical protein